MWANSLVFNIVIVLNWAQCVFLTQRAHWLLLVVTDFSIALAQQFPFESIKLFLFNFVSGSSCCWTTTAQPSTSWCCLSATMKRSNWRSSTDRWRSTQTSSVSLPVNVFKNMRTLSQFETNILNRSTFTPCCSICLWFSSEWKVSVSWIFISWLLRCVFIRSWGDAGGLPEHRSLLWGRKETPAGRQVLSEVWAVQQSKSSPLLNHSFNSFLKMLKTVFDFDIDSLFRLSGSEALPAVSQHGGQRGCRDGHRDGESVQLYTSVHVLNDQVLSKYVSVFQVGQAKDSSLTNQLIDYLMGESDGMPKVINTDTDTLKPSFFSVSVDVTFPAISLCCNKSTVTFFKYNFVFLITLSPIHFFPLSCSSHSHFTDYIDMC